ncbi:MAG: hypothetical protein PHV47_02140 [Candidatus Pacebacteria bacterium]|nr:hypothetical protein [Candidatus Paceibacterota bacterium]
MKKLFRSTKLPLFFKPILWSYVFSSIDAEKNKRTIIVNTINHGNWHHWTWIAKYYGAERIREIMEEIPRSEFSPQALKLAMVVFNIKELKYATRGDYIESHQDPIEIQNSC